LLMLITAYYLLATMALFLVDLVVSQVHALVVYCLTRKRRQRPRKTDQTDA